MYGKLFAQIIFSSLTQHETITTRGVFFMLIAISDKGGFVTGSDDAIARIINVPMDIFSEALTALMKPDVETGSDDHEGRRVVRMTDQPGLFLVNYVKYSEIANDDQRRSYFAKKQREHRAKKDAEGNGEKPGAKPKPKSNPMKKFEPPTHETPRERKYVKKHDDGDTEACDHIASPEYGQ